MTPFSPAEDTFGSGAAVDVTLLGGSVQLQSTVGEGSEFICQFPPVGER